MYSRASIFSFKECLNEKVPWSYYHFLRYFYNGNEGSGSFFFFLKFNWGFIREFLRKLNFFRSFFFCIFSFFSIFHYIIWKFKLHSPPLIYDFFQALDEYDFYIFVRTKRGLALNWYFFCIAFFEGSSCIFFPPLYCPLSQKKLFKIYH